MPIEIWSNILLYRSLEKPATNRIKKMMNNFVQKEVLMICSKMDGLPKRVPRGRVEGSLTLKQFQTIYKIANCIQMRQSHFFVLKLINTDNEHSRNYHKYLE